MILRLTVVVYLLLCAATLMYFWVGDAIVDPSSEYSDQKRQWVAITLWLSLLGPVLGGWLLYRLSPHIPED